MYQSSSVNEQKQLFGLSPDQLVMLVLFSFTLFRTLVLFISPLGLGVDEAQYWLWSQSPDFGYFTKPPLIAWIIGISHALFGHYEAAIRLPASWLHFAAALALWQSTVWLYGKSAGRLTALIWITLPAVGLGSFVISTDTPLLLAVSMALLALAAGATERISAARAMLLAGTALGVGILAKYAAVYALFGMTLIWASGRHSDRPLILGKYLLLALATALIAASPNLVWNLAHDFATFRHLGDNANIAKQSNDLVGSINFLASQAAVAGPIVFLLMIGILPATRYDVRAAWLAWMAMPALLLITFQAYFSDANANWAVAAYPALSIWLGGWMAGNGAPSRTRRLLTVSAIGVNLTISLAILTICAAGTLGPFTPKSDPLRRLRGWDQLAKDLAPELAKHNTHRIIADRRATAALLYWHLYPSTVEVMVHDKDGIPSNHFEANHSWKPRAENAVLGLSDTPEPPTIPAIKWQDNPTESNVDISHNRKRRYFIFHGTE